MNLFKQSSKKFEKVYQQPWKIKNRTNFRCPKCSNRKAHMILFIALGIFATLCLVLRMYNSSETMDLTETTNSIRSTTENINGEKAGRSSSCNITNCTIFCQSTTESALIQSFQEDSLKICYEIILELSNMQMNYTIGPDWLSQVNLSITSLKISSTPINTLLPEVFSRAPFHRLAKLTLESTNLREFPEKLTLPNLTELNINYMDFITFPSVDNNFLASAANTLQLLQLQRCLTRETLETIVGSKATQLAVLATLDVRYNNILNITPDTFAALPSIKTIYLSSSQIHTIQADSFLLNDALNALYLDNNKLKNVPEGLFDGFPKSNYSKIALASNPLICDCDFLWFKQFFAENQDFFFHNESFECFVNGRYIDYHLVDFCNNNETTPITQITETTTKPTSTPITQITVTTTEPTSTPITQSTEPTIQPTTLTTVTNSPEPTPPNLPIEAVINISCQPPPPSVCYADRAKKKETFIIRQGCAALTFFQMENDHSTVQIFVEGDTSKDLMLWMNSREHICSGCIKNVNGIITVKQLSPDENYVFCLLPENETAVSPLDCAALAVPPPWKERAWIPNRWKTLIISLAGITAIFLILITGLIVFYCIRQHPSLIRGNKRVIIVGNKAAADALVLPKNHHTYVPPSMISYSDGYLVPRMSFYDRVRDVGTMSTVASRRRRSIDDLYEQSPPPLPPNHPRKLWTLDN